MKIEVDVESLQDLVDLHEGGDSVQWPDALDILTARAVLKERLKRS